MNSIKWVFYSRYLDSIAIPLILISIFVVIVLILSYIFVKIELVKSKDDKIRKEEKNEKEI